MIIPDPHPIEGEEDDPALPRWLYVVVAILIMALVLVGAYGLARVINGAFAK